MTYQLAANLRLFYEREKSSKYNKEIYGYLSAIIHKTSKNEINRQLTKKNRTEEDLLKIISETFGLSSKLSNLDDHYEEQINYKIMNNCKR